jgi:hypothetical protein
VKLEVGLLTPDFRLLFFILFSQQTIGMVRLLCKVAAILLLVSCKNDSKQKPVSMDKNSPFKTADWVHSSNIYEVNLRQYTLQGTINAFADELPRLKEMGVKTLWFMPITPIAQKNKLGSMGSYYACSDYTAINPEFGTLGDFKKLVKRSHEMGIQDHHRLGGQPYGLGSCMDKGTPRLLFKR